MIGIRADANEEIAMGHIMRCIAIAKQIRKLGEDVVFIMSDYGVEDKILEEGFQYFCLNNDYQDKEAEIGDFLRVIKEMKIDTILLDSYQITKKYVDRLHEFVKIVYIDDLNAFKYSVDAVVNYTYNANADLYSGKGYGDDVKFYLGNRYIPLREEFPSNSIKVSQDVEGIFITTGGTDKFDMVVDLLQVFCKGKFKNIKKYIVVGKFYDRYDELKNRENEYLKFYKNINNIYDVMKKCDIAISAGGTTVAELCSMGVPTIAFSMADNQVEGVRAYDTAGIIHYSGDIRVEKKEVIKNIAKFSEKLADDYELRKNMSTLAKMEVDGKGAARIADIVIGLDKI